MRSFTSFLYHCKEKAEIALKKRGEGDSSHLPPRSFFFFCSPQAPYDKKRPLRRREWFSKKNLAWVSGLPKGLGERRFRWGRGEGEKKGRRFSPSALSHFHFHLSPFLPETSDTQAAKKTTICILYLKAVPRRPPFLHVMQRSSFKYHGHVRGNGHRRAIPNTAMRFSAWPSFVRLLVVLLFFCCSLRPQNL